MKPSISRWICHAAFEIAGVAFSISMVLGQTPMKAPAKQGAANSGDLRLVEAAEKGDGEALRSLLKQHADVNAAQADGATALSWAVYRDDLEAVKLLIGGGAKVNAANDYGVTGLSLACANGNADVVDTLLKSGANPNVRRWTGETPLMRCALTGNVTAVKALLAAGADVNAKGDGHGQSALMWAIAQKHQESARELIVKGADVNARSKSGYTPILFAAQQGDMESARLLLAAGANVNDVTPEKNSALMVAIENGREELAQFLLGQGADANLADVNGVTALHFAVLKGLAMIVGVQLQPFNTHVFRPNMLGTVKALLAHGANPNARILNAPVAMKHAHNTTQRDGLSVGATPFLLAALTCDAAVMRALREGGADPLLATDQGITALMAAAGVGRNGAGYDAGKWRQIGYPEVTDAATNKQVLEAVKLAIELGADVNAADENGQTALHSTARDGSNAIVQLLAEKGAHLNAKDKYGQTPLSIAQGIVPPGPVDVKIVSRIPHKSTAELLLKLGATP